VAEHQLGHSDVALQLITRAVTLNPSYQDAHNNLGNVYKQLGRLEEAEVAYQRALELKPEDANALSNLGTVRRELGDLDGAIHYFRAVIGLCPTHAEAWQNLGNTMGALHRYDEALDAHKEALRLRPRSSDSYRYLGAMFATLGRVQEATEIYRQWLEMTPNDPQAIHLLAACTGESIPERASDEFVRHLFDKFASSFDKNLARLEYQAPKLVLEAVNSLHSDKSGSLDVLDAGCGTGLCGPLLRPYARRMAGVDLSQLMVERAKERSVYDELFVEELTAFLMKTKAAYDLIVSADTLVYFGALEGVAKASLGALKPRGSFVFTVEQCQKDDAPMGFRLEPHGRYSHVKDYVDQELRNAGYSSTDFASVTLRKEAGKWVAGWLVTARS
jgi:predicted TPR repeat methyltransferase